MPRARSPDSIKAEKLYNDGMLLVDIAEKLGRSPGTVRRWKSTQNWDGKKGKEGEKGKKKQSERSEKKKANARKKPGAPKGNKNAAGHGAPTGNKNAEKHGGYSAIYWDTLDDDEKALLDEAPDDEEQLLIDQITLFSIRERRLMKAINKYKNAKGGVYINSVIRQEQKRTFKLPEYEKLYDERISEKVMKGDRLPGDQFGIQTTTSSTVDLVARLEKELTSIQSKKTKAIDALSKLRLEKQKLAGEQKGNEIVDDWIASVMGEAIEGGDVE